MNLSTLTNTSSIIPLGYLKDQSASYRVTIVGLSSPKPSFLKMERGIKLMLAPRSQSALSNTTFPIQHGIMKLPGSLSFGSTIFYNMALHSSESGIVLYSPIFRLLVKIFFINFMQLGVCSRASIKGIFI